MTVSDMVRVFGRIGCLSFGGPAAQIALMHKELVEDRDWLTESQFLRALSFCMLLPGPEAMQLATYAGWRQRGILGGLIAGGLFVIPGAVIIMALALAYGAYGALPWVQGLFIGIQATVVVIVFAALRKVATKALKGAWPLAIAAVSFIALNVFQIPFPLVILAAALIGATLLPRIEIDIVPVSVDWSNSLRIVMIGALIWVAPVAIAWAMNADFLTQVALFFSKLAIVTFGGAYAVLAYMTQTVVSDLGWLTTPQMMDALGLAETTPGPLILVTQFVAMIAGLAQGGVSNALLAGGMALWVTFVPCFIWIFAGAPLIDWLEGQARLQAALSGITAAVVGVIANLSVWFSLHVFFGRVDTSTFNILLPDIASIQIVPLILAAIAAILMLRAKWSIVATLAVCAALGFLAQIAGT